MEIPSTYGNASVVGPGFAKFHRSNKEIYFQLTKMLSISRASIKTDRLLQIESIGWHIFGLIIKRQFDISAFVLRVRHFETRSIQVDVESARKEHILVKNVRPFDA